MNIIEMFSDVGCMVTNVIGIILLFLILANAMELYSQKNKIRDVITRKNAVSKYDKDIGDIVTSIEEDVAGPALETVRNYETSFNAKCIRYNTLVQFIPLFPLFGILGTVYGIITNLDSADLMSGLGVALYTTFWGLVWSIILKVIVALFSSKIINEVEIMLDDYDKKYSNLLTQKSLEE